MRSDESSVILPRKIKLVSSGEEGAHSLSVVVQVDRFTSYSRTPEVPKFKWCVYLYSHFHKWFVYL